MILLFFLPRGWFMMVTMSLARTVTLTYLVPSWKPSVQTVSAPTNCLKTCSTLSKYYLMRYGYWKRVMKILNIKLDHIAAAECRCRVPLSLGATCSEVPLPICCSGSKHGQILQGYANYWLRIQTPASPASPGGVQVTSTKFLVPQAENCDEGFTAVVKKRNKPDGLPNSGTHKSRLAMVGARNYSCFPVITKKT